MGHMKLPSFLFSLFFLLWQAPLVFPQSFSGEGLVFSIEGISVTAQTELSLFVTNKTETRKYSRDGVMRYRLMDEFGNEYRFLREEGARQARHEPSVPQSLYPGESDQKKLLFERPVPKSRELTLLIDAKGAGVDGDVRLSVAVPQEAPRFDPDDEGGVSIVQPLEGIVLERGEGMTVKVRITQPVLPKKIVVLALDHTLEDVSPGNDNLYDINVPLEQAPGRYSLSVVADWDVGGDIETRSATLSFYVKDNIPLEIL